VAFLEKDESLVHLYLEFSGIIMHTDNYSNILSLFNYQCLFLRNDVLCSRPVGTETQICFEVRIVECAERITEKKFLQNVL